MDMLERQESPSLPAKWDCEKSIKQVRAIIYKWREMTVEVASELWIAREMLSKEGRPKTGTNVPVSSWAQYCQGIGAEKRTVNRWLARIYHPTKTVEVKGTPKLPEGKFGCIYADPPWQYSNQGTRSSTDKHYKTMSVEDICSLPVESLADERCHLHLWTTNAFLFRAREVIEAWGFEYKSAMIWVKPQMGIGNYWRVSHEYLLLGVRGGLGFESHNKKSWTEESRGSHSVKPERFRHLIESVSPGPYLELFARKTVPGWMVWGDEVERDMYSSGDESDKLREML